MELNADELFDYLDNYERYSNIESKLVIGNIDDCPSPSVSILIPTFRGNDYFIKALESALNQTYQKDYEIVIVDNNPFDGKENFQETIVKKLYHPNVFYYRNVANIGMIGNWNRCIELARGIDVTFCHDDDVLKSDCLEILMAIRQKHKNELIAATYNEIDKNGKFIKKIGEKKSNNIGTFRSISKFDLFIKSYGFGVGCLFNRKIMLDIGGFDERFYPSSDYALYIKYVYMYGGYLSVIPTFNYRVAVNESSNAYKKFIEMDDYFRSSMINNIHFPRRCLNTIRKACYRYYSYALEKKWNHETKHRLSFKDKFVVYFANRLSDFLRLPHIMKYL